MWKEVQDVNVGTLDSHSAQDRECIDEGMDLCAVWGSHGSEYEGWGLHHYVFISVFGHCNVDFRLIERRQVVSLPL